jgi:hypothetical protein
VGSWPVELVFEKVLECLVRPHPEKVVAGLPDGLFSGQKSQFG